MKNITDYTNRKLSRLTNPKSFTLLELIIVIIIVGILATVGLNQYTIIIERVRAGEARSNVGYMRKLANEYYLKNGTFVEIANADLGIGTSIPSSCNSQYFYSYYFGNANADWISLASHRCTSGGKNPNSSDAYYLYTNYAPFQITNGYKNNTWLCYDSTWTYTCQY